jgi:hypothetical protein
MTGTVAILNTRHRSGGTWVSICAVIVAGLMAFAVLHTAIPFHATGNHCAACLALNTPAVAWIDAGPTPPTAPPTFLAAGPASPFHGGTILGLRPLRAPPSSPVA